jgi:hypothetical protein
MRLYVIGVAYFRLRALAASHTEAVVAAEREKEGRCG